ncbi:replication restart helicase PriA [Porphyromonas loveana]|uniref:replication restart helicase PriA n=1 Tax=Porphyromonas loveana TaxID=1884669 RepID=UPI00359F8A7C
MRYAEVLIPLALEGSFHYRLPEEMADKAVVGMRCVVPFGAKRYYTGIIIGLTDTRPHLQVSFKEVMLLPDDKPSVTASQLSLWQWLSAYYICMPGEVLRTAVPSALLPESRTVIHYDTDFVADSKLSTEEQELLDILEAGKGKTYTLDALQRAIGKRAIKAFTSLVERGAIRLEEEVKSRYKPKTEVFVRLDATYQSEEAFGTLLDSLRRAPKQSALLLHWAELISERDLPYSSPMPLRLLINADDHDRTTFAALRKKEIFRTEAITLSELHAGTIGQEYRLWGAEENKESDRREEDEGQATEKVSSPLPEAPISLLYTHDFRRKEEQLLAWTEEVLREGGEVLFLSPDANKRGGCNSLTSRMAARLGSRLLTYHAFETDAKRVEVWNRLALSDEPCAVLGMRSALFLPFHNLHLIIVDEEQEYLYKQQDPAPRFHARQVAVRMGKLHNCPVVLASVTPSGEILQQVRDGNCQLITWPDDEVRPVFDLEIIDMGKMRKQRQVGFDELLSFPLTAAIEDTIRRKKMAVVLQNRRGFAPYIICNACGEKLRCIHCDVSLTYHKRTGMLVCHYCGYSRPYPSICPSCKQQSQAGARSTLQPNGFGAERMEEELKAHFPHASILRMDSDMAMSRTKMEEALGRLGNNEVDILVGTQLIKGQPYNDNVGMVAVTQLDSILGFPDFRAYERAFQLLYQLMLRSGAPKLYVQTNNPDNPFLEILRRGDYRAFVRKQLEERQMFFFPPYCRMIRIEFRASEEQLAERIAHDFASSLKPHLPQESLSQVLIPAVSRIRNAFIRALLLRLPLSFSVSAIRNLLSSVRTALPARTPEYKRVRVVFDVDPL